MEPAVHKDSSIIPDSSLSSLQGHQSMTEGLKVEVQNRISNLHQLDHPQKTLISKENAEDSDVDSGHNSIDRHSLATEVQYGVPKLSDIQTDYGRHSKNIWTDSPEGSADNYAADAGDLVIHHDSIKPTEEEDDDCEKSSSTSSSRVQHPVFTTIARKKSVFITVDKFTSETVALTEVPLESQVVRAGSTSPEVTYAKVNKKKPFTTETGGVESSDNAFPVYGVVKKEPKTKQREVGQRIGDGCYEDLNDLQNADDIGDADDLYSEVDKHPRRANGKNIYAYLGGRVMVISDEGDYASVKSLTDSDSSKKTEVTVVSELPVTGKPIQSSISKDASGKRNQYAVQYLGSLALPDEDLSPQRCTVCVSQCISHMSQQSHHSQDNRSINEWPKNSRMFLETSESKRVLTLLSSDSVSVLDKHFLYSIRFWAVGKEPNSKHFAYVTRNASQRYVCRVFLCDVVAKHIASSIRDICQRLAVEQQLEKRKSVDSTLLDSATVALKHGTTASRYNEAAGVSLMRSADGKSVVTECNYIGVIKVGKPPGKDTLNSATESVFKNIPKEQWARVDLQLSPTSIAIQELANSEGKSTTFLKPSVVYMGSSTKNKKLSAIFTQSAEQGTFAHVFHCEPRAEDFIKQIQAAFEISPCDKNGKPANQPIFQQKGLKGLLSGKSKGN